MMEVGLDPELTKWSVHSGSATVLTGKGYKEHHWLVVPPSTTSVISYFSITTAYSIMLMSARSIPGTQDQYGRGRAAVRVRGQTGNRTNAGRAITPFMFNEEGYRVSSLRVHRYTCTDLIRSMHVTRRVVSILRQTISIVVPTPTIQTKTGSKIFIVWTSSMRLVVWPVVSFVATISTLINAPLSVEVSSVTTQARKSKIPPWSLPWNTLVPWAPLSLTSPVAFVT